MRHRIGGRKLSRPTDHRMALYRNLVTDLLTYEGIITTEAKAKETKKIAEKIITLGKKNSLAARRQVVAVLADKAVVKKLFDDIGPSYAGVDGGYTRIVKLWPRKGDGAPLCRLELVK